MTEFLRDWNVVVGGANLDSLIRGPRLARLCETPVECVQEAVQCARAARSRVVRDPSPAIPLPDEFLASLDVLRPNSSEDVVVIGGGEFQEYVRSFGQDADLDAYVLTASKQGPTGTTGKVFKVVGGSISQGGHQHSRTPVPVRSSYRGYISKVPVWPPPKNRVSHRPAASS